MAHKTSRASSSSPLDRTPPLKDFPQSMLAAAKGMARSLSAACSGSDTLTMACFRRASESSLVAVISRFEYLYFFLHAAACVMQNHLTQDQCRTVRPMGCPSRENAISNYHLVVESGGHDRLEILTPRPQTQLQRPGAALLVM